MSTRPIYIFILFILVIGVNTEHTHAQTCTHVLSFFSLVFEERFAYRCFFHIKMNIYTSKQRKCDTLIASSFPMTSSICRQTFHFLVYLTDGMSSCGPFEGFEGDVYPWILRSLRSDSRGDMQVPRCCTSTQACRAYSLVGPGRVSTPFTLCCIRPSQHSQVSATYIRTTTRMSKLVVPIYWKPRWTRWCTFWPRVLR